MNNIGLFSFCENGDEGCVIYAMNTYDTFDNRLNAAFLDLPYGSCNNAFTIAPIAWSMNVSSDDQVMEKKKKKLIYYKKASSSSFIPQN